MAYKPIIDEERMFKCVWCKDDFKESDANFILSENPNECVCSRCMTEWADNLLWEFKSKEQECEKLKTQYNCYACGTCKGKEDYRNMKRHCENAIKANHRYKQALDEIDKIVSGTYYETEQTVRFKMQDIQDVIDKAKEEISNVCDNLHIICGNCGSLLTIGNENNEKARVSIDRDSEGNLEDVTIICENCNTVHSLSKYMEILD